jgi:hypothetical protein
MAVPHQALAAIVRSEMGVDGETSATSASTAQARGWPAPPRRTFGQSIVEFTWLAQGDNGSVFHRVSILSRTCGWLFTATIRRPPFPGAVTNFPA